MTAPIPLLWPAEVTLVQSLCKALVPFVSHLSPFNLPRPSGPPAPLIYHLVRGHSMVRPYDMRECVSVRERESEILCVHDCVCALVLKISLAN